MNTKTNPVVRGVRLHPLMMLIFIILIFSPITIPATDINPGPIIIGLDADLSSASAQAGQSIRRGALIAIDEINARGGVLGRPLVLETRDHHGNPARAKDNMAELADLPDLVAVLGGLHTPVALQVLPLVHERRIPFLIPWAAGTPVVRNGYDPNFVFRVSVCDADAGPFLVDAALARGYKRLGLLLENTGWGRSNQASMTKAAADRNLPAPTIQLFNWGVQDLSRQLAAFRAKGVDVILLVANPPEGLELIRTLAALPAPDRLPVISHWGITGGTFAEQAGVALNGTNLCFLQTFNFNTPPFPDRAAALFAAYRRLFPEVADPLDIPAAPGLAHACDLVHLLAKAITAAGSTDRTAVRNALEKLASHAGIMADYAPPFTPSRHDALGPEVFQLGRYNESGQVVPMIKKKEMP